MLRDRLQDFDPFWWAEKALSPRLSHFLGRITMIAVLVFFLAHRMGEYRVYLFKPLWVVETLIFVVFIVAYAVRHNPVERARGIKEIIVPLSGGAIPFVLLLTPPSPWIAADPERLRILFCFITVSTGITVWGLWALRRSFSITIEARRLITKGPYRQVRHPVYLGEILTAGAVIVWRFSLLNCAVFLTFVIIQLARARWEEAKLARVFPEYKSYAERTWWFWRE